MIDASIRIASFLVYVFLLNFFFSSWSFPSRLSVIRLLALAGLTGGVWLTALFVPASMEPFINVVITLVAMIVIASEYAVPSKDLFFWIIILLAIDFISESLALVLFRTLVSTQYAQNILFAITTTSLSMIIELFMILALKLVFFRTHRYLAALRFPVLLALASVPAVSIVVLFSFLMANSTAPAQSVYLVLLIAFGVLYMNLCMLYLYSSLTKHLQKIKHVTLQNESLAFELRHISELKKSQDQLMAMRHDLKNQFIVLLGMLEENQIADAKDYLLRSTDSLTTNQTFYTRDAVLNYLLNDKKESANKAGIKFDIKVLLAEQLTIDNEILAVLIGNLMDNALEASIRLKEAKQAEITLAIKQFEDKLLIEIENVYDPGEAAVRYRRKFEGLGTTNIKRIVSDYNGLYKQWTEGNKYLVSILLFTVTKKAIDQS